MKRREKLTKSQKRGLKKPEAAQKDFFGKGSTFGKETNSRISVGNKTEKSLDTGMVDNPQQL